MTDKPDRLPELVHLIWGDRTLCGLTPLEAVLAYRADAPACPACGTRDNPNYPPQLELQLEPTPPRQLYRGGDPPGSQLGAQDSRYRSGTQKAKLLLVWAAHDPRPLMDATAALEAELVKYGACWWHRCSDLRNEGMLQPTGELGVSPLTGKATMLSELTHLGRETAAKLRARS